MYSVLQDIYLCLTLETYPVHPHLGRRLLLVAGARGEGGARPERHGHQSADSGQDPQGLQQNGSIAKQVRIQLLILQLTYVMDRLLSMQYLSGMNVADEVLP